MNMPKIMAMCAEWLRPARESFLLGPDERRILARDVGVPESTFSAIMAVASKADELPRLMHALSLDYEAARREWWWELRDLEIVCSICNKRTRCRRELRNGTASVNYARYCPNADWLKEQTGVRH
jgi:hypothetical protein